MNAMIPKLTVKQQNAVREECNKEFYKLLAQYNRESAVQMLHILYFQFDFNYEQLKLFGEKLTKMQAETVKRYEIADHEVPDICEIQLRNAGINVDDFIGG